MRCLQLIQNRLVGPRGLVVLAAGLLWTGISPADAVPPDRVEELRQALRASSPENVLTQRVQALQGLAEMRRALILQEWRPEAGGVAESVRDQLAERFKKEASRVLKRGTDNARLAVTDLLAEMGANVRGPSDPKGIARALAPELAALVENGPTARIRQAAARALGVTFPDPGVAVRPLRNLLASSNVEERRTAAHAFVDLLRVANQLTPKGETPGSVQAERSDVVQLGTAILPLLDMGFTDADPEVRRLTAEAIEQAATALNGQVPETRTGEQAIDLNLERQRLTSARTELMPLIAAFKRQGPNLTRILRDSNLQVRLRGQRALEELGKSRMRLYHAELPPSVEGEEGSSTEPLLQTLQTALPVLTDAIEDPDPDARLGTVEALEAFGPAAEPAIPALVRALQNRNPFVRWAAARTLGKLGAVEPVIAVPELARLLYDPDLGVRLSASLALDRYGPAAKDAVPDLIQATQTTDNEIRIAAMHTLEKIGEGARAAVPALTAALSDSNAGIRRTAAETLGQLGTLAASAEPALRKALNDPDAEVRNAACDALLNIVQPKG